MTRIRYRKTLFTASLLGAIVSITLTGNSNRAAAQSPSAPPEKTRSAKSNDESIRPFKVHISEEALVDLRERINATRWPEKETVSDHSQGVPLATMRKLAEYWANEYDWRECEARLNAVPNYITEIDGLDIHFIHVRSSHEDALPVIITHGWPGSIVEQMKLIDPLSNPTAFGGNPEDAFHVVIPSMPGYGFSGKPDENGKGWDPERIARAWIVLMKRLGYEKFVAQGGDWGALVSELIAKQGDPAVIAIHTNMPCAIPPAIDQAAWAGAPAPPELSAEEKFAYERIKGFYSTLGYGYQMGRRPQTLYGISDSPIGLAAYLLDHDERSLALIARSFDGKAEGLTRDDVLDNITLFWLTNTGISAARLYWENKSPFVNVKGVTIPVAVSIFPDELYPAPRSWVKKAYPKLIYYNKLDRGGHFGAWEQPELFVKEMRAGFAPIR